MITMIHQDNMTCANEKVIMSSLDRDVQKEDGVGNRTKCINNLLVICVERMLTCNVENVENNDFL